jgi:excisionase family DNA binding protein
MELARTRPLSLDVAPSSKPDHPLTPLLTLPEASAYLRLSEESIRRLIAARRLPCVRLGRRVLFDRSDLLRWVSARIPPPPSRESPN